jgi:hypothetical protein
MRFSSIVVVVVSLCVCVTSGCGKKTEEKSAEKTMERMLTEATGKETSVDLRNGNVRVENKDMKVDIASSSTWPADIHADVPKFTGGAIVRVVTSNESGAKKFNIHYTGVREEAVKQYVQDLKARGWEANLMEIGNKAALLSAQKGNLGLTFTYNAEKSDGMISVFSSE